MKRITTGVKGLDEMLGGGLPSGRCILVCGGPGTGKTIFGIQYLYYGAINSNEPGLYISLDENPSHLKEDMTTFNWDLKKLQKDGKLRIIDASPIRTLPGKVKIGKLNIGKRDFSMLSLIKVIKVNAEEINAKRIVIDPISMLIVQYPDPSERRNAVLDLMETLVNLNATSLIISELRVLTLEREPQVEEFAAHGVIIFHVFAKNGRITKAIQVEKMRGISHDHELRPYKILSSGIEVFAKERVLVEI
jgi:circadian clock protein KaiC